ncbi:serine/threonine-protein phosphatase 6 regulatory subunit 3 [Musca vetustissima]|uniref:serine/threonine-protein phosphatase 6 regulatory subunit 3 n=1 Tax=Musca vetustissima TaxID=27455 RepID=UPI002AB67ABB|nr:serine/threonine-protein phosphatase 6 regulatory subunit 3 [Musca vetustissima]
MFWDKNDSPSQNIEALLERENSTVEEFLDEDDIIQECKTQKKSIVNYFTRPDVIKRMIELITTEPPEDLPLAQRFRHANVACEILLLGLPSLDEKLISEEETLKMLYSYLENEPPLNPLLASFFSKTFSMLFTKKSDQDWFLYQQLCLKLLEFLKTQSNFLDLICKHFSTPVIPDLIMEMMRNVEGAQLKRSLYEWLNEERLVEKLIDIIGDPEQSEKHANVAEFLCDLIHQGRTMRQSDQENDSFEPIFEGSNPILKNIESATTLFALFNVILQPNALESAIVSGITVVLKIIRPVMLIDERMSDRLQFLQDREKEIHNELLSTVIRVIEPQLKHFNELLRNPPKKADIVISAGLLSPPFGMTRLQICRLFTVLLQTNNEEICKAICETDFFDILLTLFKEYPWNNFLHSEVEKCLHTIFYTSSTNNANNNTTQPANGPQNTDFKFLNSGIDIFQDLSKSSKPELSDESKEHIRTHFNLQLIVNCQVVSRLIECWKINKEIESAEKGRRLGYMGHLIKIFKHITTCISESEHIGALIENNLKDDTERELWQSIVNSTDGELTQALKTQSKLLANCEACDYDISLDFLTDNDFSGAFNTQCALTDAMDTDFLFTLDYNTQNDSDDDDDDDEDDDGDGNDSDDNNENGNEDNGNHHQVKNALNLFQFGRSNDDDEDDDDENNAAGDVLSFDANPLSKLKSFTVTSNPWDTNDDFDVFKSASSAMTWAPESTSSTADNFADFDAHFSSFTNDMGETLAGTISSMINDNNTAGNNDVTNSRSSSDDNTMVNLSNTTTSEEYDNNANVEKLSWSGELPSFQSRQTTFIDDYEDDEGMWTKPLGASALNNSDNNEQESCEKADVETVTTTSSAITNGPTTTSPDENEKEDNSMEKDEQEAATKQLNNVDVVEQPTTKQQLEDDGNTTNLTNKEELHQEKDSDAEDKNIIINNEDDDTLTKHKSTIEADNNTADIKDNKITDNTDATTTSTPIADETTT